MCRSQVAMLIATARATTRRLASARPSSTPTWARVQPPRRRARTATGGRLEHELPGHQFVLFDDEHDEAPWPRGTRFRSTGRDDGGAAGRHRRAPDRWLRDCSSRAASRHALAALRSRSHALQLDRESRPRRARGAGALAARRAADVVAPIRPSCRGQRCPLTAGRALRDVDDASKASPSTSWMRVHARMGAEILRPDARSLLISGEIVLELGALDRSDVPGERRVRLPVRAPRPCGSTAEAGSGEYWEPNVWMRHRWPGRALSAGGSER